MKNIYLTLILVVFSLMLKSQELVKVGSGKMETNENVKEILSGQQKIPQSAKFNNNYFVVLRFKSIPNSEEKQKLREKGIILHSYISDNTYYATVNDNQQFTIEERISESSIVSIQDVNPLWKIAEDVYSRKIPEHAKVADDIAKVTIILFESIDFSFVERYLQDKAYRVIHLAKEFNTISIELPLDNLENLAKQPWVQWIEYVAPPAELENIQGRTMNRSNILGSNALGQRNLKGKDINVGLWDGSVEAHPDLGNRLNSMEFEYVSEHGQHTSGTVLGAGILDPKAMGMAPEASLWAWNFSVQQNGLSVQQEMLISARDHDVVVTSNSYGVGITDSYCLSPAGYNAADLQLDQLVNMYPQLTHVFSAGNDQEDCIEVTGSRYGTSTKRVKNAILVGALDELTRMAWFSSWGPMDDGRLLPHITAFGDGVYSTVYDNAYDLMSGTSMACPATSGTITLLYQRYKEIYGDYPIASLVKAAILNTAEDKGNPGPDYQFGYGSLNGLKAVELIEENHFVTSTIENGVEQTHTISIPAGAKELRVMLVWSDYYGTSTTKALINDLDLSVTYGANTHMPWILDHQNPEQNATKGVDRINNQEQVLVSNPNAGTYTITVNAFEVPQGPQEYALVYTYEMPKLMVTYPNGGEKFDPSDMPVFRWTSVGYDGTYTLQLSIDNGKTYETIATDIPNEQTSYVADIPDVITGEALFRVIQNGTMDVSDATFNIMPTTGNLSLDPTACGGDGWQLSWDAVADASSYKVLKADLEAGIYTEVGSTANTTFDLPVLSDDRNIYSVAAVSADGAVSERSYAIIANPSMPLNLDATNIPFEENLIEFPSDYIRVSGGNGVDISYPQTLFTYTGAHNIKLRGNATTSTWNATGDLFANNTEDVASAKMCEIDATTITDGQLWLRVAGVMGNSGADNARFRVLANGTTLTNTYGDSEIAAIESGENIMYWDLSAQLGSVFTLEFEAVLRNLADSIQFGHFRIWQPTYDAAISAVNAPEPSQNLTNSETISVDIRNYSGEQLTNIPVSYRINGGAVVEEIVAGPIEPFKTTTYTFTNKADLSDIDVAFNIEASVSVPGDEKEENNTATAQTTRFGDYYRMPETKFGNNETVSSTATIFTDNGGKVLNYSNSVNGVVVFEPLTSGKKVKIHFTEFNLENNYDKLVIRSGNLSTSTIIATLTGSDIPDDIYSLDYFGKLYVEFISDSENNNSGWVAEVSEVDESEIITDNTFTIDVSMYNGDYSSASDVDIKVTNNSQAEVTNVPVRYKIDDGEWVNETISSIAANDYVYFAFSEQIAIPAGTQFNVTAEVIIEDGLMDDNSVTETVLSDVYCFSYSGYSAYSGGGLFLISDVSKNDISNPTSATVHGGSKPQYFRSIVLPLYKDVTNETITVNVNNHRTGGKIGIWVDWNNDGDYTNDGGSYNVNTVEGQNLYNIPLTIPEGTTAGQYYTRIRATTHSTLDPCASEYSNNGEVEDYMVEVFESYPVTKDVAPVATNLANGSDLTATETVTVTIENNASLAISNFDISMTVDGGTTITETVASEIVPFDTYQYTFTATADLSAVGPHEVVVETLASDDQDTDNNQLLVNIMNEKPAVDGFFALNFDGVDDVVNAGTLDGTNLQSYTYEAWINPVSYGGYSYVGFGRLFEGKAATIFLHGEQNSNYPDHSLVISTGGGSYHTQENSIDLNKWQHVAVTFDNNTKELKVYIDGNEVSVITRTSATTIENNAANSLYIGNRSDLARAFDGIIDAARVWSVVKTQADIADNMNVSVSGQENLIAEFLFDEGYYNSKAYSGAIEATISNADVTDSENSIWIEPTVAFSDFQIPSQVIDFEEIGENHYRTEVLQSADLATLVPSFVTSMSNTNVTAGGIEQESGVTAVDFTNSATTPVEYTLTATYFGESISNTYQLEVEKELSAECEILSLDLSEISFSASPVDMDNVIIVANGTDVTSITTNFTLSAEATAYLNDVEITSGTQLDYSNPVVIKVVATNDRTITYYNISVRQEQTITWEPASLAKVYGDPVFTLQGISNSGLDIYYESSNPDVISLAMNKATVKGLGTATITAYQQGTNSFAAATPVAHEYSVSKKALTITADSKTIEYSDPIPELTMSFNGLLDGEDESVIDELPVIATSAIQNSPAGDYSITLSGGSDENYDITLVNGTLTIEDVAAYDVTFSVTYSGSADHDVNININNTDLTTDINGEAIVTLKAGSYPYLATKAGREDYSGTVDVVDANQKIDIVLQDPLPIYTINYTTDGNGTISGTETQSVKQGYDGEEVTAIPATGYIFNQWNDGVTTATRFEENVQGDVSVIAQFELKTYTLTYDAGTNGTLSGDAEQTVEHGSDGTSVEAIPNTNYSFVQWSDGVTDNPRTDVNVMMDKTVTAEYTTVYTLPYTQNFEGTELPEDWENVDNAGDDMVWEFKAQAGKYTKVSLSGSTPNSAILDSDSYGSGGSQDADLISPTFDLTTYSAVYLSFNHHFKSNYGSSATLSFSINGGAWVEIQHWISTTVNPEAFDRNITDVIGQKNVRFKWTYVGSWGYYWLVDDIEITGVDAAVEYTVTYTAGANGTIEGATGGVITQSVIAGESGPTVTAVPNPGFAFYQWSDGITDNPRTDLSVTNDITVVAEFELITYTLSFNVADGETPISGATITLNEQSVTTDENGKATYVLQSGDYSYSITAEGYDEETGYVSIVDEDKTENVTLSKTTGINDVDDINIEVYPNPVGNSLKISNARTIKRVTIINAVGQIVDIYKHDGSELIEITTIKLKPGVYIISVEVENKDNVVRRVIKK